MNYDEIVPWYEHVERFIGINGTTENLPSLPDGVFQPPMPLNKGEAHFSEIVRQNFTDRRAVPGRSANLTQAKANRAQCQFRNECARGCSFGAYFSTQSSTLPAAQATG